jgi:hypothetical protein
MNFVPLVVPQKLHVGWFQMRMAGLHLQYSMMKPRTFQQFSVMMKGHYF